MRYGQDRTDEIGHLAEAAAAFYRKNMQTNVLLQTAQDNFCQTGEIEQRIISGKTGGRASGSGEEESSSPI